MIKDACWVVIMLICLVHLHNSPWVGVLVAINVAARVWCAIHDVLKDLS